MCFFNIKACHVKACQSMYTKYKKIMIFKKVSYDPFKESTHFREVKQQTNMTACTNKKRVQFNFNEVPSPSLQ